MRSRLMFLLLQIVFLHSWIVNGKSTTPKQQSASRGVGAIGGNSTKLKKKPASSGNSTKPKNKLASGGDEFGAIGNGCLGSKILGKIGKFSRPCLHDQCKICKIQKTQQGPTSKSVGTQNTNNSTRKLPCSYDPKKVCMKKKHAGTCRPEFLSRQQSCSSQVKGRSSLELRVLAKYLKVANGAATAKGMTSNSKVAGIIEACKKSHAKMLKLVQEKTDGTAVVVTKLSILRNGKFSIIRAGGTNPADSIKVQISKKFWKRIGCSNNDNRTCELSFEVEAPDSGNRRQLSVTTMVGFSAKMETTLANVDRLMNSYVNDSNWKTMCEEVTITPKPLDCHVDAVTSDQDEWIVKHDIEVVTSTGTSTDVTSILSNLANSDVVKDSSTQFADTVGVSEDHVASSFAVPTSSSEAIVEEEMTDSVVTEQSKQKVILTFNPVLVIGTCVIGGIVLLISIGTCIVVVICSKRNRMKEKTVHPGSPSYNSDPSNQTKIFAD